MIAIYGLRWFKLPRHRSVVAIGIFDGVHAGHARVISSAVRRAKALGLKSVVMTFDPHPAKVLGHRLSAPSLMSIAHRTRLMAALGPDYIVIARFSKALAALGPAEFAEKVLVSKAGAAEVFVGDNFYFGKGAKAGSGSLASIGRKSGFRVNVVPPVMAGGHRVSSSAIRSLISKGRLSEAARLLGRPVSVYGTVAPGARIATELGYPTANINPHHEVVPPSGVYAVIVDHGGRRYKGVLNIGWRPTFYAPRDMEPTIEVHIFGFRGRLYGKDLEVSFIKKLRDERRFSDSASLVRQIRKDGSRAIAALRAL